MNPGDPINRSMQRHILAAVLQNHLLFGQVASVLKPEFFSDEPTSDILAWATAQWRSHKQVPSKVALLDAFKEESRKEVIKKAFVAKVNDEKYTAKRIVDYATDRAVRLATRTIAEHMAACDAGNPPVDKRGKPIELDAVGLMRKAVSTGTSLQGIGTFLDEMIDQMCADYLNPQAEDFFTTGSEHLDGAGLRLSRGEVGCVLAKSKAGKSHQLLNIAIANAAQGRNVIYYNVEIKEKRLLDRFAKRIAGRKADLSVDPVAFVQRFKERFPKLIKGRILIQRYFAGVHSFDDVRSHLDQVKAIGFNPDMAICDYVGIMKAPSAYTEKRHQLEQLWLEFRSICAEYNIAGWGAAQANRGGAAAELVSDTDIGESYAIISHLDAAFSLNMTDEEAEQGIGRAYILASRNSRQGTIVNYAHDLSRSIIQTTGIATAPKKKEKGSKPGGPRDRGEEANEEAQFRQSRRQRQNGMEQRA